MRKEEWYEPDLVLYCDMILFLGKNKLIKMAEELFSELKKEGLQPSTRAFAEMIGAYIQVDMTEKAMETYESMKASGCTPDRLTFMILIRNLEKAGKEELAAILKKECAEYIDLPEKFLEEVEQKHVRILSLYVLMFVIVYPTLCAKVIFPKHPDYYAHKALFSDCYVKENPHRAKVWVETFSSPVIYRRHSCHGAVKPLLIFLWIH